jgi:hypothetical protein
LHLHVLAKPMRPLDNLPLNSLLFYQNYIRPFANASSG